MSNAYEVSLSGDFHGNFSAKVVTMQLPVAAQFSSLAKWFSQEPFQAKNKDSEFKSDGVNQLYIRKCSTKHTLHIMKTSGGWLMVDDHDGN